MSKNTDTIIESEKADMNKNDDVWWGIHKYKANPQKWFINFVREFVGLKPIK